MLFNAAKRARAGAFMCDVTFPGWASKVDPRRVNLMHWGNCMIGQIMARTPGIRWAGSPLLTEAQNRFDAGRTALYNDHGNADMRDIGFAVRFERGRLARATLGRIEHWLLKRAWRAEIAQRLAITDEPAAEAQTVSHPARRGHRVKIHA